MALDMEVGQGTLCWMATKLPSQKGRAATYFIQLSLTLTKSRHTKLTQLSQRDRATRSETCMCSRTPICLFIYNLYDPTMTFKDSLQGARSMYKAVIRRKFISTVEIGPHNGGVVERGVNDQRST